MVLEPIAEIKESEDLKSAKIRKFEGEELEFLEFGDLFDLCNVSLTGQDQTCALLLYQTQNGFIVIFVDQNTGSNDEVESALDLFGIRYCFYLSRTPG